MPIVRHFDVLIFKQCLSYLQYSRCVFVCPGLSEPSAQSSLARTPLRTQGSSPFTIFGSDGDMVLDAAANVSGRGILEFTGGTGHELTVLVDPLVKISGNAVVTFNRSELSLGRGLTILVSMLCHSRARFHSSHCHFAWLAR